MLSTKDGEAEAVGAVSASLVLKPENGVVLLELQEGVFPLLRLEYGEVGLVGSLGGNPVAEQLH
jgi:hypothetical protein